MIPTPIHSANQQKKFSLVPIFFTVFIDMIGVGIVIPILAIIFLDFKNGILDPSVDLATRTMLLGFLIACYPLAQFFGAPILGTLSDRFGRKKLLLISLYGTFFGYLLFTYGIVTRNIYLLFLSRTFDGFTGGNISIAMSSIADISDEKAKARNFGLIGMAFGLGFIIGPYIGGKLSDPSIVSWFNYATPFVFAATLCYINIALVLWRFRETLGSNRQAKISFSMGFRNIAKALKSKNLRTIFIVIFLMTFGFNFFTQFFQVYLIQKFSFTQSQIGDLFAYIGLWIAFTQGFINRFISKKFSSIQVFSVSALVLGIAMPMLLIPDKAYMLLFIMPFVSVANGLSQPNSTAIVSSLSDKTTQGEILGINQSFQSLGMAIPPIIAGFIVSLHRTYPLLVAGGSTILAWLIFMIFFRRKRT